MSPLGRGVRTFLASMAAVLASVVAVDWTVDYRTGLTVLGLGVITSLVAGVIAYGTAYTQLAATTVWGKALNTFWQFVVAGLGTVVVADLTGDAIRDFGVAVLRVVIGGAVSALATAALNGSEQTQTV